MRLPVVISLFAALSASLSACATSSIREPARVQYRNASPYTTASGAVVRRDCRNGYEVRGGDTLSEVAEHCGVPMRELAEANGLNRPYTLRVGQRLDMPRPPVHVVQRGENLYRIVLNAYGTAPEELVDADRRRVYDTLGGSGLEMLTAHAEHRRQAAEAAGLDRDSSPCWPAWALSPGRASTSRASTGPRPGWSCCS